MANNLINKDIKYINRDFFDFKNSLIEYSKTYYPNTFNDFTPTSTGMLFIEMASYVGDVLSFYIDNQIQETFIQYARQTENVYNLANLLGYKPKTTTVASTNIDFYQQLPAISSGSEMVPDYNYALKIPRNTQISSNINSDIKFLINEDIDFSISSSIDPTTVTIYEVSGNQPTSFLIKKTRKGTSSTIKNTSFSFGTPQRFDTKQIIDSNIIGILDVTDLDGNVWYEVPNLAQDSVFEYVRNINTNDPNKTQYSDVPYILRLKQVQRRFTTRFVNESTLELEFGAGITNTNDETITPNLENIGNGLPFERSKLRTAFSPLNFMFTNTYGVAPSNTTLNVRYLVGGGITSNVESGTLTVVDDTNITFVNSDIANDSLAQTIFDSVASNNPLAADGGSDGDSLDEVKQNALGNFQSQLRSVTSQDYLVRALSMPSNLGVISKAYIEPTKLNTYSLGEVPKVLDLYVLSFDSNKKLRNASVGLKENLRTYLNEYRIINDSLRIKDAYIVNIGIKFDIVVLPNFNNTEIINRCIDELVEYFNINNWQINQPILYRELYVLLDRVLGVQTVKNIQIFNKSGENLGYSKYIYDIDNATIDDVIYPSLDPCIFEIKNFNKDIEGRVVQF